MEKFSAEGDITIFCWNFFSHSAEKFREGNHSMFQINSGMENFMQKKEISLLSVETYCSHSADKFRGRNYSMFQKKSGIKNFSAEEGDITIFCWNFFFPQCQKLW